MNTGLPENTSVLLLPNKILDRQAACEQEPKTDCRLAHATERLLGHSSGNLIHCY
jgi:hypothetical protein